MALIPLGILSAAATTVAVGTDYELIATAFGTGSSDAIIFSSIPAEYKHLQVRYVAKTNSTARELTLRVNGVNTNGSYAYHSLAGSGNATPTSSAIAGAPEISLSNALANSTTAGLVSSGVIDILDYASTTKNTTIRALYGQPPTSNSVNLLSGLFISTAAVNSLRFGSPGQSFTTITRFSLYGIKG